MRLTRKAHRRSRAAEAGVSPGILSSPFLVSFFRAAKFVGSERHRPFVDAAMSSAFAVDSPTCRRESLPLAQRHLSPPALSSLTDSLATFDFTPKPKSPRRSRLMRRLTDLKGEGNPDQDRRKNDHARHRQFGASGRSADAHAARVRTRGGRARHRPRAVHRRGRVDRRPRLRRALHPWSDKRSSMPRRCTSRMSRRIRGRRSSRPTLWAR